MRALLFTGLCAAAIGLNSGAMATDEPPAGKTGPSTTTAPYLEPREKGVSFVSILTAGDAVGAKPDGTPWRMVGDPDGLGAFDNGDGAITVLMNHELDPTQGAKRAHGAAGAFVSRLVIDKKSLRVLSASDLIKTVKAYNRATKSYEPDNSPLGDLCSGDLPERSALYDEASKLGYDGRVFMSGEEKKKTGGRAFAHIVTGDTAGTSYELPLMGKMAFENLLAHPRSGKRTIVAMSDDTKPFGQIYFYIGEKQASGEPVEKAGLTNGRLYGLKIESMAQEPTDAIPVSPRFALAEMENVADLSGEALDAQSDTKGVTKFQRPEDGAWDKVDPNRFYFNTTAAFDLPSRVWAVDFDDHAHPEKGGTLRMIYQTTKDQHMLDNMTVTDDGLLVLQEDPGDEPPYLARVYQLDPRAKKPRTTTLAEHDPALFSPGDKMLTLNEESSGVIDVTHLLGSRKQRAFLLDVQAHGAPPKGESKTGEIVEGGQLLLMREEIR